MIISHEAKTLKTASKSPETIPAVLVLNPPDEAVFDIASIVLKHRKKMNR